VVAKPEGSSPRAADHDMHPDAVLAPAGILEVDSDQLNIVFGTSRDTSDFVADCLELRWTNRQSAHSGVRRLLIDLDNGPEIASSRTQFMKRLVEFSDRHQLTLELAYYPPYHSKYNLIERCWGILEGLVAHWPSPFSYSRLSTDTEPSRNSTRNEACLTAASRLVSGTS
jgi:hypothetical protein